jgi:hypothetical protein
MMGIFYQLGHIMLLPQVFPFRLDVILKTAVDPVQYVRVVLTSESARPRITSGGTSPAATPRVRSTRLNYALTARQRISKIAFAQEIDVV